MLFNALMAGMDDETFWERQQRAWKEGHLRWMDVDVTPIYRLLGGKTERRKYFSLIGHFRDPVKFLKYPGRSFMHKGSVVGKTVYAALIGQDWRGRQFTTFNELVGCDDKKKLAGQTVGWKFGGAEPIGYTQLPSYIINQGRGYTPIQVQNLMAWTMGEIDAFDAITKSMGLMTATTYPEEKK